MRGNPHAAFDEAGAGNAARSRWCDTRRRKSEQTGNTNFGLNRRVSPRPYPNVPMRAGYVLGVSSEAPDAPDGSEEAGEARFNAVDEAARSLLITPAICDDELWHKVGGSLRIHVSADAIAGPATDNRAIMALGCIKADLLRLGIGRPA